MFTRQVDGSVKPVSTEALEAIKKKKVAADESLGKLLHDMSDKK